MTMVLSDLINKKYRIILGDKRLTLSFGSSRHSLMDVENCGLSSKIIRYQDNSKSLTDDLLVMFAGSTEPLPYLELIVDSFKKAIKRHIDENNDIELEDTYNLDRTFIKIIKSDIRKYKLDVTDTPEKLSYNLNFIDGVRIAIMLKNGKAFVLCDNIGSMGLTQDAKFIIFGSGSPYFIGVKTALTLNKEYKKELELYRDIYDVISKTECSVGALTHISLIDIEKQEILYDIPYKEALKLIK